MAITISIYSKFVNCDRYHLLKPRSNITNAPIYQETGISFNGFDKPVIVNTSIENIFDSRIAQIQITQFNNYDPIFCLIRNMQPVTANKTLVYLEIDGWMNYRNLGIIGKDNYLFETSKEIDYPYYELNSKSKLISKIENIENSSIFNVLMLYHNSATNSDTVYYFAFYRMYGFGFYSVKMFQALQTLNIDTNNIIGFYLSPFDVNSYFTNMVYEDNPMTFQVYSREYNSFITTAISDPKYHTVQIIDNYLQKTVITDMTGSPVWTSIKDDNGNRLFVYRIDLRYDGCLWDCSILTGDTLRIQYSPNKRFGISCIDLGFFIDYYQEYQNIQKSANSELRKAQLEKQLIDNMGGIISSTTSGLVGGAIAGNVGLGAVSGAVGGLTNMVTSYFSTADYNAKLETIEERQAKLQYDNLITGSNSFLPFILGESEPCLNLMTIDNSSINSGMYNNSTPYLKYNCRIRSDDLFNLIYNNTPLYLSGDFDFVNTNQEIANQLNERFKHGVYFVEWVGDN